MSDEPRKKGKICHPKSGKHTHHPHFAAFGLADKGVQLSGKLTGQSSGNVTAGKRLYPKKPKEDPNRMFWILYFSVPAGQDEKYTLQIYDDADGHELDRQTNIELSSARLLALSYPQMGDSPLPLEFTAYGTSDAGGDVSGTMTNCDTPPTDIEQIQGPPDWVLYCDIVNPVGTCVLTVWQGEDHKDSGGLTFGTS